MKAKKVLAFKSEGLNQFSNLLFFDVYQFVFQRGIIEDIVVSDQYRGKQLGKL